MGRMGKGTKQRWQGENGEGRTNTPPLFHLLAVLESKAVTGQAKSNQIKSNRINGHVTKGVLLSPIDVKGFSTARHAMNAFSRHFKTIDLEESRQLESSISGTMRMEERKRESDLRANILYNKLGLSKVTGSYLAGPTRASTAKY
jgi:hypothetical protein